MESPINQPVIDPQANVKPNILPSANFNQPQTETSNIGANSANQNPITPETEIPKNKGSKLWLFLLILLIAISAGYFSYKAFVNFKDEKKINEITALNPDSNWTDINFDGLTLKKPSGFLVSGNSSYSSEGMFNMILTKSDDANGMKINITSYLVDVNSFDDKTSAIFINAYKKVWRDDKIVEKDKTIGSTNSKVFYITQNNGEIFSVIKILNKKIWIFDAVITNKEKRTEYIEIFNKFLGSIND